jgi:hypothetical protein
MKKNKFMETPIISLLAKKDVPLNLKILDENTYPKLIFYDKVSNDINYHDFNFRIIEKQQFKFIIEIHLRDDGMGQPIWEPIDNMYYMDIILHLAKYAEKLESSTSYF